MPPTIDELVTRFNALTAPLLDPMRYARPFAEAVAEVSSRGAGLGTPRLHAVADVDKKVMPGVLDDVIAAFAEVEATVTHNKKGNYLAPLRAAAIERFGEASRVSVAEKEKADAPVYNAMAEAVKYKITGADREELRTRLEAKLDVILAKSEAISERDRAVQRLALKTSLLVSACGVLLAALISFGLQYSLKRDDRNYQRRETFRAALLPTLDSIMVGAMAVVDTEYRRVDQRELALRFLSAANRGLYGVGKPDSAEIAGAFNPTIAVLHTVLLNECLHLQDDFDSLVVTPSRKSGQLVMPQAAAWRQLETKANDVHNRAFRLKDLMFSFDR